MEDTTISYVTLAALRDINAQLGDDPAKTFVAAMTAAALAGHIIERTPEQMREMLDRVSDVALTLMLRVTETRQ